MALRSTAGAMRTWASVCCVSLLLLCAGTALAQAPAFFQESVILPTHATVSRLTSGLVPPRPSGPNVCVPPWWLHPDHRRTSFGFTVKTDGTVANLRIVQSSGSPPLDIWTEHCVAGWLYTPGRKDGQPVSATHAAQIDWITIQRGKARVAVERITQVPDIAGPMIILPFRTNVRDCERWYDTAPHGVLLACFVRADGSVTNIDVLNGSGNAEEDRTPSGAWRSGPTGPQ